jgi:hypothetical protein
MEHSDRSISLRIADNRIAIAAAAAAQQFPQ